MQPRSREDAKTTGNSSSYLRVFRGCGLAATTATTRPVELQKLTALASRSGAFVAERHPFALAEALDAFETVTPGGGPRGEAAIDALRPAFRRELARRLELREL